MRAGRFAKYRRAGAGAAGAIAALIGILVLSGWALNIPGLTTLLPGLASMKANAAMSVALLGVGLLVAILRPSWRMASVGPAVVAFSVVAATIVEYLAGTNLGLDEALFRDPASATNPGRMSLATAIGLGCVAAALVTLDSPSVRPSVSHVLGLVGLTIAGVALLGYLYGVSELYSFAPFATIALHTATALALLSVGIVLAQPESGSVGRAAGATPGGYLIRRLLPATALVPIALGFLVITGARAGHYSAQFAVALLVVAIVILLRLVIFRTAGVLDAADAARREAAEDARRSGERERIVMQTIADGIVTIDQSSRIEFVNRAAERMFGYAAEELVGQRLTMLMPEPLRERHLAALGRYAATGIRTIVWEGTELIGRRKTGEEFAIEVAFAEDRGGDHRTFTGAIRDISARHRLEAQLRQAQRLESIGRLAGGIAHDFNNILTAILGFARLTIEEPPEADPRHEKVRAIEEAGQRASVLVGQLLAFSRQQVLRPQVIDLGGVANDIRSLLERLLGEDIAISLRATERLWQIEADRGQLEQIMVNLAVNARDAMPDGGRLTIESSNVELDAAYAATHPGVTPGPHVLIAVSDTGTGMDAETLGQIFEPFFTTKEPGRGTGLGLATVYGIVKQSGGHIWAQSEPGQGTTFRIYFPRSSEPGEAPDEARPEPIAATGSETILVAEDEEILRDLIEVILRRLGYRVLLAADTPSAMALAQEERFDMLLTDVVMPGQSGLELARAIRSQFPGLPVLFMSGYTAAALEDRSPMPAGHDLLQKPFTPQSLGRAVRAALDQG